MTKQPDRDWLFTMLSIILAFAVIVWLVAMIPSAIVKEAVIKELQFINKRK